MADLSLKRRMTLLTQPADRSVRAYATGPTSGAIGLRSLLSSFRLIHISDPHFTGGSHTLDWRDGHLVIDTQDSPDKSRMVGDFLCAAERGPEFFDTRVVVITGDLTDSGDEDDYPVALAFIDRLTQRGFDVHVTPGNHDYCKEGNLIVAEVLSRITPPLPPGVGLSDMHLLPDDVIDTIRESTKTLINELVPGDLGELLDFLVDQLLTWPAVTDTVGNAARRQRFIDKVTHDGQYPRVKNCGNGWLILLDSMQGQFEGTYDLLAQGKLGAGQISLLAAELHALHADRMNGKPVVVCLHHSPYLDTWTNQLDDRDLFLSTIKGRLNCLLFGHVGSQQEAHDSTRPADGRACMPLGNSENLEPMSDSYAVTVVDFGARMRAVFQALDGPVLPPRLNWLAAEP